MALKVSSQVLQLRALTNSFQAIRIEGCLLVNRLSFECKSLTQLKREAQICLSHCNKNANSGFSLPFLRGPFHHFTVPSSLNLSMSASDMSLGAFSDAWDNPSAVCGNFKDRNLGIAASCLLGQYAETLLCWWKCNQLWKSTKVHHPQHPLREAAAAWLMVNVADSCDLLSCQVENGRLCMTVWLFWFPSGLLMRITYYILVLPFVWTKRKVQPASPICVSLWAAGSFKWNHRKNGVGTEKLELRRRKQLTNYTKCKAVQGWLNLHLRYLSLFLPIQGSRPLISAAEKPASTQ